LALPLRISPLRTLRSQAQRAVNLCLKNNDPIGKNENLVFLIKTMFDSFGFVIIMILGLI
jgi:hypothetical protein